MAKGRIVKVIIEYDGKDITGAVSNSIIELTYTDKSANEADEISLSIHDREGNWRGDWYPKARGGGN